MISELCSATGSDAHFIHGCLLQLETSGYVRQISRSEEIINRVWEVSHDFVARLLGPILKNPFRTFWERFWRVFYPLSIGVWAVAAAILIFAGPWLDRKSMESRLEKRFGFSIEETAHGYVLTEQDHVFDDLAAASPYLKKLNLQARCGPNIAVGFCTPLFLLTSCSLGALLGLWIVSNSKNVLGRSDVPTNRKVALTRNLNPVPASQLILCRGSSIAAAHRIVSLPSRLNSIRIGD